MGLDVVVKPTNCDVLLRGGVLEMGLGALFSNDVAVRLGLLVEDQMVQLPVKPAEVH